MNRGYTSLLALLVVSVVFLGCGNPMHSDSGQVKFESGLAGLTFNDDKFTRPDELDILSGLDNDWGADRGNDWSARWSGFIEASFSGEVTFFAEVNDGLRLTIGDVVVIDGLDPDGPRTGAIILEEGKRLPVTLHFTTAGGMAKLRLFWQWQGRGKTIVPTSALGYDPAVIDDILKELTPPSDVTAEMLANQYSGPRDKLHIYLLIGQSNMAGRAAIPPGDKGPMEGCFMLDRENRWLPASNPLNRYSTIISNTSNQRLNPGYMFAKTMRQNDPNISIGLICNARGATSIEKWMPGTRYYTEAIKRVKAAAPSGVFKGVLWHQGEGNYTDTEYLVKLKKLIGQMREDIGDESMFFVAGGICESDKSPGGKLVNAQLARLGNEVAMTGYASSEGLDTFDGKWHFGPDEMKILGRRYAEAVIKL
ncbi:MAG: sialate O-acetylesterase, partial [Planctomycetota bacterium]